MQIILIHFLNLMQYLEKVQNCMLAPSSCCTSRILNLHKGWTNILFGKMDMPKMHEHDVNWNEWGFIQYFLFWINQFFRISFLLGIMKLIGCSKQLKFLFLYGSTNVNLSGKLLLIKAIHHSFCLRTILGTYFRAQPVL